MRGNTAIVGFGEALPETPPQHGDNALAVLGIADAEGRDQGTRGDNHVILIASHEEPLGQRHSQGKGGS